MSLLSPRAFYCLLDSLVHLNRTDTSRCMAEMSFLQTRDKKEKSYCNPTRVCLRTIPSNSRNIECAIYAAILERYFLGDACRGHVQIKSFRRATYTYIICTYVRYDVRVVYQRMQVSTRSTFSRAVTCVNFRDR